MHTTYVFGDFIVDPQQRRLTRRSGEVVTIGPKAFDALAYLVRHAGEVVSRRTLIAELWPAAVVVDNGLSQTIRSLRLALGDTLAPHQYVVTVPRRGYQFAADVFECPHRETLPTPVDVASPVVIAFETRASRAAAVRPRRAKIALGCALAVALIVCVFLVPRRPSMADVPDQIIPPAASAWPLPPVVACRQAPADAITPHCIRILAAAKERERRWKRGLQAT
jgi:DNA-binding winged helix-turn-helix (wHTH) protein